MQPARVYYPPSGVAGWGVVGGLGLQELSDTVSAVTTVDLAPSQPFLRSIVEDAPALRSVLSCPVAGVRQYAVLPLAEDNPPYREGRDVHSNLLLVQNFLEEFRPLLGVHDGQLFHRFLFQLRIGLLAGDLDDGFGVTL